ncbi:MAG TPA: GYD domain-containing protein [Nitrosopumilaceae archaeon]|nr:GYD domain-containing protein [Nitrosopumilaceae archaeon]
MIFITLIKFRKKASEVVEVGKKIMQNLPPGVKIIATYWTLGRYDSVWIFEGRDEKDAIKLWLPAGDVIRSETLVSLSREDALKLL